MILRSTLSSPRPENQGLLDVAMSLLDTQPGLGGRADARLREVWSLGSHLVLLMVQRAPAASLALVIRLLTSRILSAKRAFQYVACLANLVKRALGVCLENFTVMSKEKERTRENRIVE